MNRIRHLAYVLTALAASLLAVGSAPAFATVVPPPSIGGDSSAVPQHLVRTHLAAAGGMPGWQITLIAVGTALLAATRAVLLDRARTARRYAPTSTA